MRTKEEIRDEIDSLEHLIHEIGKKTYELSVVPKDQLYKMMDIHRSNINILKWVLNEEGA